MNHLRHILFSACLIGICLLAGQQAGAQEAMKHLGTDELQKVFVDLTTASTSLPKKDLEVNKFSATPDSMDLPAGDLNFRIISGGQAKALGQQILVAEVWVDGVAQGRVKLSGDLALYGDVVCTTSTLSRHSIIAAHNLKRVRRNLTMLGPDLVTNEAEAIGKELKMTLQPGAILYGNALKQPEIVKRGDLVSILAANNFMTITVPGRVQNAGAKGDLIKVKNLMSRKEIMVRIIGPGSVQAQF